jgi:hypothetical protein
VPRMVTLIVDSRRGGGFEGGRPYVLVLVLHIRLHLSYS